MKWKLIKPSLRRKNLLIAIKGLPEQMVGDFLRKLMKKFNKNYEDFLLTWLIDDYSKTRIEKLYKSLRILYSEDVLQVLEKLTKGNVCGIY